MDYLLLQSVRRLAVGERCQPSFSCADCRAMEVAQLSQSCAPGSPPRDGRESEFGSAERAAIFGKVLT